MAGRRRKRLPEGSFEARIDSLSHDGRGVAHIDGKAVFIDGALPGETVEFVYTWRRRSHDEGRVARVIEASPDRVEPRCPHAGLCGGCSLQHMAPAAQIEAKQQTLLENFERLGQVTPVRVLPPLQGPVWGYRRKARLGVRHVPKKGKVLVGFREKRDRRIADLSRCEVLDPAVGRRIEALSNLIGRLSIIDAVPQIEVAVGDFDAALVFRVLAPPSEADRERLAAFGRETGLRILLQPGGPETVAPLWPEAGLELTYRLPEAGDLAFRFLPTDFTQVNAAINRAMVQQALTLLELEGDERVLDLFCGLGNFTLPIARQAREVVGVEGEAGLVGRARANAAHNGIDNVTLHVANLMDEAVLEQAPWLRESFDRVLLDPPRSGAKEVVPRLGTLGAERIVYVSCHPATLARDAGILVHELGYRLEAAGVMDMFPHTAHVESMALFVRG